MKVCVVGLGEVGLPTALHYESLNIWTIGYDISRDATEKARAQGLTATSEWGKVPDVDVYVICVDTNIRNGVDAVFDVCHKIKERSPQLVSIESTILVGTTRLVWEDIFDKHIPVCHVPQRFWARDPQQRGVQRRRPLGVPDADILPYAKWFYEKMSNIPIDTTFTAETAEFTKVAENAWTFVWIAFAEELAMLCSKYDIDYNEIRLLVANASDVPTDKRWSWQPQYNLARAEHGIGGKCLPMAMEWLLRLADDAPILHAAKMSDIMYREWRGEE